MLTDIWGALLSLPADFWLSLRFLLALNLPGRTKNPPDEAALAPDEADPDYPPGAERPSLPKPRVCSSTAWHRGMLLSCDLEEYHFPAHYDQLHDKSWRTGPHGLEVRKGTGPAPVLPDASR